MSSLAVPARLRGAIAFWALAGIALLLSHDAVFLAQVGPGEQLTRALRSAGHDYWGIASLALAALGATAAAAAGIRLVRLRRRVQALGVRRIPPPAGYARRSLLASARLFALVAAGFVVQENLEHLAMHAHPIGFGALLGPEYPLALPVIGAITLLGGTLAGLIGGAELALLETIAAAMKRLARAPRSLRTSPLRLDLPPISVLARAAAGRAPPQVLASAT